MAIDGPKILESDLAYDTYEGVISSYQKTKDIKALEKKFKFKTEKKFDDLDNEIYISSMALAFWELGLLSEKKAKEITKLLQSFKTHKMWCELIGKKHAEKRKTELEKLCKKIEKPNKKPIKLEPQHKEILEPKDVLVFKIKNKYAAILCSYVYARGKKLEYNFAFTNYYESKKPSIKDLEKAGILCSFINSGASKKELEKEQQGLSKIWKHQGVSDNLSLGLVLDGFNGKDLKKEESKFENIGKLTIKDSYLLMASVGVAEKFDHIVEDYEQNMKTFSSNKSYNFYLPVSYILEKS